MESNNFPRVSIIIPARDEEENIGRCLKSIFSLNYPQDKVEVIVVDNGSTDNTCAIAHSWKVKVVECGGNIGAVRNAGVRIATGDILAFLDADCVAQENWLFAAVTALEEKKLGIVGGICLVDPAQSNWVERAWVLDPLPQNKEVKHIATASFIIRKEVFEKVGGFNEDVTSGEDMELSSLVRQAGYRLHLLSECAVFHYGYPKTLFGVLKRQIWHSSSYLVTMQDRKNLVFLMTHIYLLSIIMIVPEMVVQCDECLWANFVILFGVPIAASIYKFYKNKFRGSIWIFFQSSLIMVIYFIGRSIGLSYGYYNKLISHKKG